MLDRFTASSTEITTAGLGRLLRSGLISRLLLVAAGWCVLAYGLPLLDRLDPWAFGGGRRLPELVVPSDLLAVSDCRADACTVETVSPDTAPLLDLPVRWLPAPAERLPWPARPAYPDSFMADEVVHWIADRRQAGPSDPPGPWRLHIASNLGGLHYVDVEVPSPGYVSRLVFPADSNVAPLTVESHGADTPRRQALVERRGDVLRRWRAAGNGRGPDGSIDHGLLPPDELMPKDPLLVTVSPRGIEFQPMPMPLSMQLPAGMAGRVQAGDPAILRFEAPDGYSHPIDVAAKVTGTRGDLVLVETDQPVEQWLRTSYFYKALGRAPASDRVTLRVQESLGGRAGASVRVPISAVVRRPGDAGATVWVIVAGLAAPVNVAVGTVDGDVATVNEITSPLSGAIHPADWRAMTLEQRALLYRAQARRPTTGNRMLDAKAQVVLQPSAALRPGTPLRSR